jgi:hypothetical protein
MKQIYATLKDDCDYGSDADAGHENLNKHFLDILSMIVAIGRILNNNASQAGYHFGIF